MTIPKFPFGKTGHDSSRTLFGAAALGGVRQDKADKVLEQLLARGINHLDTAASYGESELRIGPWMNQHRADFFVASKTGERTFQAAKDSLHRSLERLQIDQLDLIQMHNLVAEDEWQVAMGPGGALEALVEARDQGLVRFIGVTGHGTRVAERHLQSLEHFDFDSVLLPYNFSMMAQPEYAADFERLVVLCRERGVAIQTIKSVARRRWQDDTAKRFSWYEPFRDPQALKDAVQWVLRRDGFFLNTSSDLTLLEATLDAAQTMGQGSEEDAQLANTLDAAMAAHGAALGVEPLFVRGFSETV